jgi:hypothetical protein
MHEIHVVALKAQGHDAARDALRTSLPVRQAAPVFGQITRRFKALAHDGGGTPSELSGTPLESGGKALGEIVQGGG